MADRVVVRKAGRMSGAPTFRRTRVTPETLFEHLAEGYSLAEIIDAFPTLDEADCRSAIIEAGRMLAAAAPVATDDE